MAAHQAGVEIDHQARHRDAGTDQGRDRPAHLGPEQPSLFPRFGPCLLQRVQPGRVHPIQHPPGGRGRRHAAEQPRLVAEHRQV
jgi:hypothetical protein